MKSKSLQSELNAIWTDENGKLNSFTNH